MTHCLKRLLLVVPLLCAGWAAAEEKAPEKAQPIGASTCLSCHQDREAFHKNIHARAWPKAKGIEFEQTCETCHGNGSLHAAAAGDKNNPGYYSIKNPAKMKPAEVSRTCLECHSGSQRMHWLGSVHEAKNVSCVNCHSMHNDQANGGQEPLLTKKTELDTCLQCHAEKKAQLSKSAHMPLLEGKMSCTNCHNPHGSAGDKLMAKNSITETCYQCHQDKRGPFLWEHAPVRENCATCHDIHGSHNEYMLNRRQPMLCQSCHQEGHAATFYDQNAQNNLANSGQLRLMNHGCTQCHSRIHGSNHPSGRRFTR